VVQLFHDQVGWIPASSRGEAVAMQKIMPIKFKLAGGKRKKTSPEQASVVIKQGEPLASVKEKSEGPGLVSTLAENDHHYIAKEDELPAQKKSETTPDESGVFHPLEKEASPSGNMQAFYDFLAKNITYPKEAIKHRIEGTAYIRFIIDENGNVEWAEAVEGREVGYGIDEEAIRVLKMTKWTPGRNQGRAVKQRMILPIKFSLPQEKPKKRKG
jgi:TonB family protein